MKLLLSLLLVLLLVGTAKANTWNYHARMGAYVVGSHAAYSGRVMRYYSRGPTRTTYSTRLYGSRRLRAERGRR